MRDLLLEIGRCPVLEEVLDDPAPRHPCANVALSQWSSLPEEMRLERWRELHQVPEPWAGHIREGRILFVSSNPSISGEITVESRRPPGLAWNHADADIVERYEDAFDTYIIEGIRGRGARGPTRFWIEVRSRANELIPGRPVVPGKDYVLTEVVHCKSRDEVGVTSALGTCSRRYLDRVVSVANAIVIVFLGAKAEAGAREVFGFDADLGIKGSQHVRAMAIGGRERIVGFLPHPNFRGHRKAAACWQPDELAAVRQALA